MRNQFLLFAFLLLFINVGTYGQMLIQGKVIDEHSKSPISFANIGIVNSRVGTISNKDGSFSIEIPETLNTDTLSFYALGYVQKSIPTILFNYKKAHTVSLRPKDNILEEVTVSSQKEKRKNYDLGNRYFKGSLNMSSAEDANAGTSVALLIQNKYPSHHENLNYPVFLQTAKLRISENTVESFKIRVRIYEVDSISGLPGKDMLHESLVLESSMRKGWLDFDLTNYNLQIDGPFFLAFEWIMEEKERHELKTVYREFEAMHPERVVMDTTKVDGEKLPLRHYIKFLPGTAFGVSLLPFSLSNYECYSRSNSLGRWERAPFILSARTTVSSQPFLQNLDLITHKTVETTPCQDTPPICEARDVLRNYLDENSLIGAQIAVSVDGKLVVSEAVGMADLANGKPVTNKTQFRIGSVSKSLTSAALIKLEAEGKLDLDAEVTNFLPAFPKKSHSFSTRQLAGHLAGIRHYRENDSDDLIRTEHFENATEALATFQDDSLLFEPGSSFHYSSFGWNLIGAVIEQVSGQNYLDYMRDNIWQPLSMMDTYGDISDSVVHDKSVFYYMTGEEAIKDDVSYKHPSGGLLSTAENLVTFGNELLYGNFFDQSTIKQLFESQFTSDSSPTNYGLGWNIYTDRNGHTVWFHSGNLLESSSYLLIYPEDKIVVAFLANSGDGLSFDIQKIGEIFYSSVDR